MNKIILFIAIFILVGHIGKAQLYSSGNNIIAGNSIGIGTSTPVSTANLHIQRTSPGQSLYIENPISTSSNSIRFVNDLPSAFANFTKYGSAVNGGYNGIANLYPYANALGFGNNGPFLNAGASNIGFAISKGGTYKLKIHIDAATERLGLGGNAVPAASVHINSSLSSDTIKLTNATTGHGAGDGLDIMNTGNNAYIFNRENGFLSFGTNNTNRMSIGNNGVVMIGNVTMPAGYKLYVETGILTEKIKVSLKSSANWADYVFAENYKLTPLKEVESFIQKNKHLPGMLSADKMVEEGLDLAKMDAKLLEKIEELTLYMIKLEKEVEQLKATNDKLQQSIQSKN